MSALDLKADYETIAAGSAGFAHEAERMRSMRAKLQENRNAVLSSWQGRGAQAFAQEMDGVVLPCFRRLEAALQAAGTTLQQVSRLFQIAEEEAARLVAQAASGSAPDAETGFVPTTLGDKGSPQQTPADDGRDPTVPPPGVTFAGTAVPPLEIVAGEDKDGFKADETVPPGTSGSQFFVYPGVTTLCGELCLTAILRQFCPELFPPGGQATTRSIIDAIFYPYGGPEPLMRGTDTNDLIKISTSYLPVKLEAAPHAIPAEGFTFADFKQLGDADSLMMVPVKINGDTGVLYAGPGYKEPVYHWMVVTGTGVSDPDGVEWVRVYDPFDNTTKYYPWADFNRGMVKGEAAYSVVEVKKPA